MLGMVEDISKLGVRFEHLLVEQTRDLCAMSFENGHGSLDKLLLSLGQGSGSWKIVRFVANWNGHDEL